MDLVSLFAEGAHTDQSLVLNPINRRLENLKAAASNTQTNNHHYISNTRADINLPFTLPPAYNPCHPCFFPLSVPPHTHTMSQTTRNYQPPSAHHLDSTRDDDEHDAGAPSGPVDLVHDDYAAVETTSAPSTGIRKSPSSSTTEQEHQDTTSPTSSSSSSETSHIHHDPRRGVADFTTPVTGIASNLPAWAIAALQETLDQPWKAHFNEDDAANAERDMSMRNDPDFARGRDTVPFYDGRLKVCYGEGSISA